MDKYKSLNRTASGCKYRADFIPMCRRRTLYHQLYKHLDEAFCKLAAQKGRQVEEGHLMPTHVRMIQSIPSEYVMSQGSESAKARGRFALQGS